MNFDCASDSISQRHKDENGFLHVALSHISKETVNPYYGQEIPGWQEQGLEPDRVYYGYRAGEELAKAAPTFNGLPLLQDHHVESADVPQKEFRVGSLGTAAAFRAPYLDNALIVTDADAIRAIEAGKRMELSAAYMYEPDFTAGEFAGQAYDFVMRHIRGNHVALVAEGRAGPDVVVADHRLPRSASETISTQIVSESASRAVSTRARHDEGVVVADAKLQTLSKRTNSMSTRKFAGAQDAERQADQQGLAQAMMDVYKTDPKTGERAEGMAGDSDAETELRKVMSELEGKLAPEDAQRLAVALAALACPQTAGDTAGAENADKDAETAKDSDPENVDPSTLTPEEKRGYELGLKAAKQAAQKAADTECAAPEGADSDAEKAPTEKAPKEKAMDSAALLRHVQAVQDAMDAVRPHVGSIRVNLATDTASTVYGAALDALGIERTGQPSAALRGMFQVAVQRRQSEYPAMDAARCTGSFAGLGRITTL